MGIFDMFIGGCIAGIALVVVLGAHDFGRMSVGADCKRDGFFWASGMRYDCTPSKRT